jgi:hypothetical protein
LRIAGWLIATGIIDCFGVEKRGRVAFAKDNDVRCATDERDEYPGN